MAAEKITRSVQTSRGTVKAVGNPLARQTFVALPTQAAGQAATNGGRVPVILANNARQTHPR